MMEYNQILVDLCIIAEIVVASVILYALHLASLKISEAQENIGHMCGELVEQIVQVRQDLKKINKYLKIINKLKKYNYVKNFLIESIDILNLIILLAPDSNLLKFRKLFSIHVIKSLVAQLKA